MTHAIVQFASADNSMSVVMGGAPTNGNLLLAICTHWSNNPTVNTGWTGLDNIDGSTGDGVKGAYKYAGAGESTTQAPFNNGTAQQCVVYEISGVSGTIGTDLKTRHQAVDISASPAFNSTSFNTGSDNVMIIGAMSGNVSTGTTEQNGSVTAGITADGNALSNSAASRHATMQYFHKFFSTSGSAVQFTDTFPINQGLLGRYMIYELAWEAPPAPTGGASLLLSGVG